MREQPSLAMGYLHNRLTQVDPSITFDVGQWYLGSPSAHRDALVVEAYRQCRSKPTIFIRCWQEKLLLERFEWRSLVVGVRMRATMSSLLRFELMETSR